MHYCWHWNNRFNNIYGNLASTFWKHLVVVDASVPQSPNPPKWRKILKVVLQWWTFHSGFEFNRRGRTLPHFHQILLQCYNCVRQITLIFDCTKLIVKTVIMIAEKQWKCYIVEWQSGEQMSKSRLTFDCHLEFHTGSHCRYPDLGSVSYSLTFSLSSLHLQYGTYISYKFPIGNMDPQSCLKQAWGI